jgi:hypothetical protein
MIKYRLDRLWWTGAFVWAKLCPNKAANTSANASFAFEFEDLLAIAPQSKGGPWLNAWKRFRLVAAKMRFAASVLYLVFKLLALMAVTALS